MTCRLRLIAPLLAAAAALVSGCGSDTAPERASASSDVNALLRSTFDNLGKMGSANVDLKLRIEPRGASAAAGLVAARLTGPFASQGAGKLPKFHFDATLQSGGRSVTAGATYTGEKGYITLQGTPYEVSDLVLKQFVAGYEQALKTRKGGGGLVLGGLGIDFTKWLKNARNEGAAKVGDADTIKLTGTADVNQVTADLDKIAARARALNIPGASGKLPERLTPQQRKQAAEAIKALNITVYTGAEDRILRRLVVAADLRDAKSNIDAAILLDVTFTEVGKEQSFEAPENPKPFSELLKAVDAAGLGNLGGLTGEPESLGKDPVIPNNVDKYADCIAEANGNRAKAQKCASLLSG
jgi:hypothetical protein